MSLYRLFLSSLLLFAMACTGCLAYAQAITQMPNAVKICDEGCTVTSASVQGVTLQFGTNTSPGGWAPPFTAPNAPLLVSCASTPAACSALGGDPLPSVVKEIDAQQAAAAYTVLWTDPLGATHTTSVPALPPVTPLASATAGIIQLLQLTCAMPPVPPGTVLPPGLPPYGTPLICAVAVIQQAQPAAAPIPPATASK